MNQISVSSASSVIAISSVASSVSAIAQSTASLNSIVSQVVTTQNLSKNNAFSLITALIICFGVLVAVIGFSSGKGYR